MIKIEPAWPVGFDAAIRGMRNPLNSWDKMDSYYIWPDDEEFHIGPNDHDLMMKLRNAGPDHRKFMRMIVVHTDITAPLYFWKQFDCYKIGTVSNSCSTMHKIAEKEFTLDDFSHEHLLDDGHITYDDDCWLSPMDCLREQVHTLNMFREQYLKTNDKKW